MSVNSTSNYLVDYNCHAVHAYVFTAYDALKIILLLTLSVLVVYLSYHEWRQKRSSSHSDVFTYHLTAIELIGALGCIYYYCSKYTNHSGMIIVRSVAYKFVYCGEICFHVLTCVERYLAVVHPITYLGLRNARGVKIRNIITGCVWLLNFGLTCVRVLFTPNKSTILLLCFLVFSIIIISFCSLSVLRVLVRSGPGEGGREKDWVDQSKQRAFYTITAISCAVWFWFVGLLVSAALNVSPLLNDRVKCLMSLCAVWFNLPSCLVLPLLYLHRAGKLSCCYNNK